MHFVSFDCQRLKEPVTSVAAGLRHSLAATRTFFSYVLNVSMSRSMRKSRISCLLLLQSRAVCISGELV